MRALHRGADRVPHPRIGSARRLDRSRILALSAPRAWQGPPITPMASYASNLFLSPSSNDLTRVVSAPVALRRSALILSSPPPTHVEWVGRVGGLTTPLPPPATPGAKQQPPQEYTLRGWGKAEPREQGYGLSQEVWPPPLQADPEEDKRRLMARQWLAEQRHLNSGSLYPTGSLFR